jgi:hypothetical protein
MARARFGKAKPHGGGDDRSQRIEVYRGANLAAIEDQHDTALVELAEFLRVEHDAVFAPSTIWRFLDRHSMTFKKARTPASRISPTCSRGVAPGSALSALQNDWSSSTRRPVLRRRWLVCVDGQSGACGAGQLFRMGTGKRQLSRAHCA